MAKYKLGEGVFLFTSDLPQMQKYVGGYTVITKVFPVMQGEQWYTVSFDNGLWNWREDWLMRSAHTNITSFQVGDKVKIIKYDLTYWNPSFDRYVGMTAILLMNLGPKYKSLPNVWELCIDNGPSNWSWFETNMELVKAPVAVYPVVPPSLSVGHLIWTGKGWGTLDELTTSTRSVKPAEGRCKNKTCGKMNDVGVAKCWSCECSDPVPSQ